MKFLKLFIPLTIAATTVIAQQPGKTQDSKDAKTAPQENTKPERPMPTRPERPVMMRGNQDNMEIPNLTEEQKTKIKDIKLKNEREMLTLKNQIGEKKAKLKTQTTTDSPNMNEVNKTIDEIGNLKSQINKRKAAAKQEIRSLLNEEQKLAFDTQKKNKNSRTPQRSRP